jgi:DNA mismatch endonuclease, patch repair protein
MAAIKGKNTKPEMYIRKYLYHNGFRYRLHDKALLGKPDIVLRKYKTAIFVHGCFWHRHSGCKNAVTPKSNTEFWEKKLNGNVIRDKKNHQELTKLGWNVIVIWECQIKIESLLKDLLTKIKKNISV